MKPLKTVEYAIELVANGEADIKARLPHLAKDEVGRIANAFNRFVDKLENVISQIIVIASCISETSSQAQMITLKTGQAIEDQVESMSALDSAIDEVSRASFKVSESVKDASENAHSVHLNAKQGSTVVESAVKGMTDLKSNSVTLRSQIEELVGHYDSVTSVLELITKIAEQTNLLALNAAIEAARAGEHGRGFAVVADEVRALSQQTSDAVHNVHSLIDQIRVGSHEAISAMTKNEESSKELLDKVQEAGDSFKRIVPQVEGIHTNTSTIEQFAQQQEMLANKVNEQIKNIYNSAQGISATAKQNTSDNGDLSQYSVALEFLVKQLNSSVKKEIEKQTDIQVF